MGTWHLRALCISYMCVLLFWTLMKYILEASTISCILRRKMEMTLCLQANQRVKRGQAPQGVAFRNSQRTPQRKAPRQCWEVPGTEKQWAAALCLFWVQRCLWAGCWDLVHPSRLYLWTHGSWCQGETGTPRLKPPTKPAFWLHCPMHTYPMPKAAWASSRSVLPTIL